MKLEIEIADIKFRVDCEYIPACYEAGESETIEIRGIHLLSHGNVNMTEFFKYLNDNELDWNDIERMCLHAFYALE